MKSTGMTRQLDRFGRIVLPKELRNNLNIDVHDPVEIYVRGKEIILEKYDPNCCFCGGSDKLFIYKNKILCRNCANELKLNSSSEKSDRKTNSSMDDASSLNFSMLEEVRS